MKSKVFILAYAFLFLFSCGRHEKPKLETTSRIPLSGEYTLGSNSLEVRTIGKSEIAVELCLANENCAVPCYIGKLKKKKGSTLFLGKVHANLEGSENEIHSLFVKFKGSTATVSTNENWELGISCFVDGDYNKK